MFRTWAGPLLLMIGLLGSEAALSIQPVPFGFFKTQSDRLVFSTSAQSILAGNCSGVTTVQNQSAAGNAKNVTSNLTVNLTAVAGVTYYSDASCTSSVTSVVIGTGTSTASYYFISDTTGTKSLQVTTVSGLLASQDQTIGTNPFVWTGGGGNTNWNTAGNWSGGAAPSANTDVALFNSTCSSNCSPTINTSLDLGGIRLASGYSGTVTQAAGNAITLNTSGWVQLGGTFAGGNSNITLYSPLAVTGGTFTSTSGTIAAYSNWTIGGTATFNKSTGSIRFIAFTLRSLKLGSAHYNNVQFESCGVGVDLSGETISVDGMLNFAGGCGVIDIYNGSIMAYGDVANSLSGGRGTALLTIAGNPLGQTITGVATGYFPQMKIDAGTNAVTLSGYIAVYGSFTATSASSLTTTGSTLDIITGTSITVTPGAFTYNNLTFNSCGGDFNLGGGTMNVAGTLTFSGGCGYAVVNNGTISTTGNVTHTLSGGSGSVVVKLIGNALGQTITGIGEAAYFPALTIEAGANAVTLSGTIHTTKAFTVTSAGSLTTTGSTLMIEGDSVQTEITPGSFHYNNVKLAGCSTYVGLGGHTMYVDGTLTFHGSCGAMAAMSGTLAVAGNVTTIGAGGMGSVQLQFVGTTDQTVTVGAGALLPTGNVTVATTSGAVVNLGSAVTWNQAGQTTTVTSGSINMGGFALTVNALSLNSTTVTKGGGILTVGGVVAGTGSLYGGTVAP